jgi:hypothetical protein
MSLVSSGESGEPLRRPLLARLLDALGHHTGFQVDSDKTQHLLVTHPPGDPRHQCVVRTRSKHASRSTSTTHRTILDGLACTLDRLVGRAPRPKTESCGLRSADRTPASAPATRPAESDDSSAVGTPRGASRRRASGSPPSAPAAAGRRPPRAAQPHRRPLLAEPRPQLVRAHPVDACGTGVLLDESERRRESLTGEESLPQTRVGGVRRGLIRRRGTARLSTAPSGFTFRPFRRGP